MNKYSNLVPLILVILLFGILALIYNVLCYYNVHDDNYIKDNTECILQQKYDSLQKKYNEDIYIRDSIIKLDSAIIKEQGHILNTTKNLIQ